MQSTMLRACKLGEKVPQVSCLDAAVANEAAEAAGSGPRHMSRSSAGGCRELSSPHTPAELAAAAGHPVQRSGQHDG